MGHDPTDQHPSTRRFVSQTNGSDHPDAEDQTG